MGIPLTQVMAADCGRADRIWEGDTASCGRLSEGDTHQIRNWKLKNPIPLSIAFNFSSLACIEVLKTTTFV